MGKNKNIEELTNLMSIALRHRIGSIVNKEEIYAQRYAKDAENIMEEAKRIVTKQNWNDYNKKEIRERLRRKLLKELTEKDFLDNKKFEIMDEEMGKALKEFNLD